MLISNGRIVGVVASGVRICAQSDAAPDIYVRVSNYISWIEGYIREL
jgi:secreted trypsin-like serine protease